MKSGYESLVWINDSKGKQYVCHFNDTVDKKTFDQLSEDEKTRCSDVNQLIGTERW